MDRHNIFKGLKDLQKCV